MAKQKFKLTGFESRYIMAGNVQAKAELILSIIKEGGSVPFGYVSTAFDTLEAEGRYADAANLIPIIQPRGDSRAYCLTKIAAFRRTGFLERSRSLSDLAYQAGHITEDDWKYTSGKIRVN